MDGPTYGPSRPLSHMEPLAILLLKHTKHVDMPTVLIEKNIELAMMIYDDRTIVHDCS